MTRKKREYPKGSFYDLMNYKKGDSPERKRQGKIAMH